MAGSLPAPGRGRRAREGRGCDRGHICPRVVPTAARVRHRPAVLPTDRCTALVAAALRIPPQQCSDGAGSGRGGPWRPGHPGWKAEDSLSPVAVDFLSGPAKPRRCTLVAHRTGCWLCRGAGRARRAHATLATLSAGWGPPDSAPGREGGVRRGSMDSGSKD